MLSVEERKAKFKDVGYTYDKKGILAFQKRYMMRKGDYDGIYGQNTENTLLTVWRVRKYTKSFKPEEFRCECGGRYCCGYPSSMKTNELKLIQSVRDHYRKLNGSISKSKHLKGKAIDFYQKGVTDTLANRKKSLKWIKKQPNFSYGYGNGINSCGYSVRAPYMGNALHIDTK